MTGLAKAFLAAEGALYALFMLGDIGGLWPGRLLKFAAIALVAAMGARAGRQHRLTAAALGLTLLADVFLLLLNSAYAVGVALFLAVQGCYALRLAKRRGRYAGLLPRAVPALLAALLTAGRGVLVALPAAYICVFAVNLLDALWLAARGRERPSFALGLLLFFCCDLCVGAYNLPAALLPGWLPGFAAVAMWGFYLPGQVLILASTGVLKGEKT